jgi:glycosyltransferase involved in cell wall biosynthesis
LLTVLAQGVNWFAPGSGGLDRVFRDLALSLPQQDIALHGLVLGPPDVAALTRGQVLAFGRGGKLPMRLLAARMAMRKALLLQAPDVVALHFALFAAPTIDLLKTRPVVMHFHGPWAEEAAAEGAGPAGVAVRAGLERSVYRRATRLITLSEAFATLLQSRYGIAREKIRVVPGSVDLTRFAPKVSRAAARAALGWPAANPILLAVRRLVRRMGLDRLIAAMPAVCAAVPGAMLMIAGRGAEEGRLKSLAEASGVGDNIRFLGFVADSDLPLAYRAADLNIVPSRALEGFGLTAAEALAAGTPSLVSPIGGLPEVVAPLDANLVFRSGSAPDIAGGLVAALTGGAPGETACISYARARFAPERAAAGVAAIYREAASCKQT